MRLLYIVISTNGMIRLSNPKVSDTPHWSAGKITAGCKFEPELSCKNTRQERVVDRFFSLITVRSSGWGSPLLDKQSSVQHQSWATNHKKNLHIPGAQVLFFSQTRRRAAYHYIKKKGGEPLQTHTPTWQNQVIKNQTRMWQRSNNPDQSNHTTPAKGR